MGRLLTIGHSKHEMAYFISLLKQHHIDYLLDVRSTPYSKYAEQFNRENIRPALELADIRYSFMGRYLGARPSEIALYDDSGCLVQKRTPLTATEPFWWQEHLR